MSAPRPRVRPPAVAGTFYPADQAVLADTLDRLLAEASVADPAPPPPRPKALIAPHAGYVYSGPVAATAYRRLLAGGEPVQRVVLFGPAHRVPVRSLALSSADAWSTPLGVVPIDAEGTGRLLDHASRLGVVIDDRAHATEHSLEVHVPFLQRVLPSGFSLLPVVVGTARTEHVADALELVWGGPETVVVVSTDLSHYHSYGEAVELDRATAARIVAREVDLRPERACGAYPVRGLLEVARRNHLDVELVDLRNSGDTAGPRDQVVGYGAFALR